MCHMEVFFLVNEVPKERQYALNLLVEDEEAFDRWNIVWWQVQ